MGKQICEDWANVLFNERVSIVIDDEATKEFVHSVFDSTNAWERINEKQEEKMYAGTVAYVPYADNVMVDFDSGRVIRGEGVKINYVTGSNILPLKVVNGDCIECAFTSRSYINDSQYIYLQMCVLNDGVYQVENHLFRCQSGQEEKIPLNTVKEFEQVAPTYNTGSTVKPYALDKPALANHILTDSIYGVSVFANAIPILEAIDTIFDSYVNEFVLGKKRIIVREGAAKTLDGNPVFDPNDTAYYMLPEDLSDNPFLKEIDMKLRAGEHQTALDDMLNLLSYRAGFGFGAYQFNLSAYASTQTATGEIIRTQKKQQTREKHLKVLDRALKELITTIIDIGINILKLPLKRDANIKIEHDDSIIEDHETRLKRMKEDAEKGFIKAIYYVMEAYHLNQEEATEMMPSMNDLESLERGIPP